MSDVFISYKAEDRKRLFPLVEALEAEGFSVWWDQHIGGGTNWREEIETHLDAAKVVLVVWSKLTIGPQGRFVRDEAGAAQEAGHYLPITIDNVRPPLGFREVQALDLSSWWGKRDDPRFKVLADTIRHRLEGGDIAPRALALGNGPAMSRRTAMIGGAGVAAAAAAGGFVLLKPTAANANRIVVLPFANLSGASEDYFADGLAEELRGALSRAGMQVIGRNSSEAVAKDKTSQIVDELKVSHILTGSVRKSPDTLRVSAQLVEGKDGVESWSQTYDRAPGDSIKIQSDIAEQVASALSIAMGVIKKAVELGGTANAQAQSYILQSSEAFKQQGTTRESITSAIDLCKKAVALDPNYARAWIALGVNRSIFAGQFVGSIDEARSILAEAERDIRRGQSIAPGLAFGYSALAGMASQRLDLRLSLQNHRRAIALAPNSVPVLVYALNDLPYFGSIPETEEIVRRLVSLDPLNSTSLNQAAFFWDTSGRVDEAISLSRRAVALTEKNATSRFNLAVFSLEKGDFGTALKTAETFPADDYRAHQIRALAAARRGQTAEKDKEIEAIRASYGDYASYQYAQIHAQAGDIDRAFAALDTAVKVSDPGTIGVMRDPFLKPLRRDPRMLALLKRLKFPIIDPGIGQG